MDTVYYAGFGNNLITPYVSTNNVITQKTDPTLDISDFVMTFSLCDICKNVVRVLLYYIR